MELIAQLQILGEVGLAMLLGGLIGLEREAASKPAGFRTNMLVAGTAALLVGLSAGLLRYFSEFSAGETLSADPIRIVHAIVIGISFLGAGTIIRRREGKSIEGLTTAASILLSAAVGIAVALKLYLLAAGTTLLAFLVLKLFGLLEVKIRNRGS